MEKRTLLAIALSFLILVTWNYFFAPPPPPPQAPLEAAERSESRELGLQDVPPQPSDRGSDPNELEPEDAVVADSDEEVRYENDFFEVALINRGARAVSWKLHGYAIDGALELIPRYENATEYPLAFDLDDADLARVLNEETLYEVQRETLPQREGLGSGEKIVFSWSDGRGSSARKAFTFWSRTWLVDVEAAVVDRGRTLSPRLALGPGLAAQDADTDKSTYYYGTGGSRGAQGVWNLGGIVTRRKGKKLIGEEGGVSGDLRWAGLEDQYFTALVLAGPGQATARWRSVELTEQPKEGQDPEETEAAREPVFSVSIPESGARIYFGPKNYRLLQSLSDQNLERVVWFATNPFLSWISKQIFFGLLWIHDHIAPNYGLAIILATLCLRMLLFPVNQYSMVSMKKAQLQMQRLQPKIKGIKAKYKKAKDAQSRAKMNEETMALYRKEGVNPMGGVTGCLPMLAQFPILIGFYNMLTVAVELRGAPFFGWIQDLSEKDPFYVTPILMAVTMFVQQKVAMSKVKDPVQQQQQKMMLFMPLVFGWICMQMPAGMVLYWFVNNVLGIGQQWLVNRQTGRLEAAAAQKV